MDKIPVILLAAGCSSRMGQAKQLLPWGNTSLIQHQIAMLNAVADPLIVVLGSRADEIKPIIANESVTLVINENWEAGMGTSVAAGVKQLNLFPNAVGVLFALIDQPLVNTEHYFKLIHTFRPGKKQIVASRPSAGWLGVPALFDSVYFDELSQLDGKQGAKTIIEKYANQVVSIDAGEQLADIDTPEAYKKLQLKRI
ncbi:nucleotidyltransferase family protein [Mangrovibacterium diazotrophicum]|uniref:Molybdenum cofactor cytidylyltransferase n=1 Tax=Mangrovibacterium diazotrophicum TaxID=1261403 RepID=A0A419W3I7_9BACT|nr:nucleotidyltransferase family protein [Mangrovibacterium diazotrophicum]RKD90004.1 molybdenum cofactor cytidylyltransferase [Mangrovibacterium diazotrophicum]